jgi:putative ABC transport system substrate-binding protein
MSSHLYLVRRAASTTVPIVFAIATDPVQIGLVGLNRPGGNITGVVTLNVEIAPKRLELLHDLFPAATSFALLVNPTNAALAEPVSKDVQAAARTLGIKLSRIEQLATLTIRHALPVVYQWREFVAAGGLLSYGNSGTDVYRRAGVYTGRILKGEKPADLPVEQTTKIELFINLKTANALGISVPTALIVRADELDDDERRKLWDCLKQHWDLDLLERRINVLELDEALFKARGMVWTSCAMH